MHFIWHLKVIVHYISGARLTLELPTLLGKYGSSGREDGVYGGEGPQKGCVVNLGHPFLQGSIQSTPKATVFSRETYICNLETGWNSLRT